jgi:DNA-directed RNA polymerase subunit RPC12/RpoP
MAATVDCATDLTVLHAVVTLLDRLDYLLPVGPFRGQCPRCREEVLVVELAGRDVVLDVMEVLATLRCPRCASNVHQGNSTAACWRCGGTRFVGEDLPSVGVRLDAHGDARPYTGERAPGDAVHRWHSCPTP